MTTLGWIVLALVLAAGPAGGVVGTVASYRAAAGQRERSAVITAVTVMTGAFAVYPGLTLVAPQPIRGWLMAGWGLVVPVMILWATRTVNGTWKLGQDEPAEAADASRG